MSDASAFRVDRLVTQPFGANTYLLSRPGSPNSLLIDPGEDSEPWLLSRMNELGGRVEHVVLTHEHFDHLAGLEAARRRWHCRLICSQACSEASRDPARNFSRYLIHRDIVCAPADLSCEQSDWALEWNGARMLFIPTPGHSPGSICIAVEGLLFSGDTLLPDLKQVTRIPGGNKDALKKSIEALFAGFAPGTMVYPGHGEPFALREVAVTGMFRDFNRNSGKSQRERQDN